MKKNFFPMALMAIAMGLNACSSDDPVVNAGGGNVPFADGGYVKMAINMPSAPSSRAYSENFGDGLENEYEVKNATLILFDGTSEDDAKFHSAYDLPVSMTKDGNTQITSTTKIVKKVENSVPNSQLYAYVVLNDNGLLDVASSTIKVPSSTGTITTTSLVDMKFSDFRKTVVNGGADKFKNDGFLMDNAPLLDNNTTSSKITSLVDISGKVFRSKAEAEAKPATEIFVERALAKVTVADKTTTTTTTPPITTNPGTLKGDGVKTITGSTPDVSPDVEYTIEGWTLDVTNKSSYLGRNFNSAWNAITENENGTATRFVGTSALRTDLFRTYWAEDPNYGGASYTFSPNAFNYLGKGDGNLVNQKLGESTPLYCMENTFDVANQKVQQTTRAIVKVKFRIGTFYTFNGDNSMLYDKTNMEKRVLDAIKGCTAVMEKMGTSSKTVTKIEDSDIKGLKLGWVETVAGTPTPTTHENECDGDGKIYVLGFSVKNADGNWISIDNNTFTGKTLVDVLHLREIMMYKEGYAYYPVLIKHFGDDLTPWNRSTADFTNPYGTTSSETNKYLGRYGVVRNNWYNIDIKSINNVGSAVVPNASTNESFDDKPENYISVRINVLSWAKRNQEEHL